ncbi:Cryptococcal mannosyltransferase 1 [Novymonas esmeraldas]|uniref:Cryptococcal mannosyltransferase 1 n=1 Tax=Novymonas esmeraldas TaxID=1808958 RepID=A0AAW0EMD5_9TRYP
MVHGRAVRHAAVLAVFVLLLLLGVLREDVLDGAVSSYDRDVRARQEEVHGAWTLLTTSRADWQGVPLALDHTEYPHATAAFLAEYIHRTTPPQLRDVRDPRTLASSDFFEELQIIRQPGSGAAEVSRLITAQREHERVAARAEAHLNRRRKSWKTRRSTNSLFHFFSRGGAGAAVAAGAAAAAAAEHADDEEEDNNGGSAVGAAAEVVVRYPAHLELHYSGSSTAFTLAADDVHLVPYPWVPPRSASTARPAAVDATSAEHTVSIAVGKRRVTVPRRRAAHTPTHGWDHFYMAVNLWKNEAVLPDLTEALVVFLEEEVKPLHDLATRVVVSIYASVSPDRTAELIDTVLIPRLHAVGVRHVYATTEGACLGYVERQPFHERIEWMACIRNKALEPLYEAGMSVFTTSQQQQQQQQRPGNSTHANRGAGEDGGADGLVVLFFNDIFFRPQDVTTLLESRAEPLMEATTMPHGWVPASPTAAPPPPPPHHPGTTTTTTTTFDVACGMDFYFTFYDTWVARDRLGHPFDAQMPYTDDHPTQEAFSRALAAGRRSRGTAAATAIPVKCCWNGLAAIRGRLFLAPAPPHRRGFDAETEQAAAPADVADLAGGAAVLQRASGAVYDRIGDVRDVLNTTALARYYTRVLARRLQSRCASWSATRHEIAEVTGRPLYSPETCANSSSFARLLQSVVDHEAQHRAAAEADWTQLQLETHNHTPLLLLLSTAPERARRDKDGGGGAAAAAAAAAGDAASPPAARRVADDSLYFRARHPAVRFRHAFTPSYGATVAGQVPVRDDVCLSSECLLLCQDVMHAALLQDRRAPIILLNPNVRVAYEAAHFDRIMRHGWFFANPYVYRAWTVVRRAQLWWWPPPPPSSSDAAAAAAATAGQDDVAEGTQLREHGVATSALDDWLTTASTPSRRAAAVRRIAVQAGNGSVVAVGHVDVAALTRMDCQRITAGSIELAMGGLYPLIRVLRLLIVALLLRWLCWQVQTGVMAASAWSVEERLWRRVYHTVWHSRLARWLRWCADGGAAEEEDNSGHRRRGRRSPSPTSSPLLHRLSWQARARAQPMRAGVAAAGRIAAQTLLWLLGALCCVRFWCGCRPPPSPFAKPRVPDCCVDSLRRPRRQRSSPSPPPPTFAASHATTGVFREGGDDVEAWWRQVHRGAAAAAASFNPPSVRGSPTASVAAAARRHFDSAHFDSAHHVSSSGGGSPITVQPTVRSRSVYHGG